MKKQDFIFATLFVIAIFLLARISKKEPNNYYKAIIYDSTVEVSDPINGKVVITLNSSTSLFKALNKDNE